MKLSFLALLALVIVGEAQGATVQRRSFVTKTFTPGTSLTAYGSGDQIGLGGASVITGVPYDNGGVATLQSAIIRDTDAQGADIDLVFFKAEPTLLSVDNGAISVRDQSLADVVGHVSLTADSLLGTSSVTTLRDVQLPLKLASNSGRLWVLAVSRGTPTYTAGSSLNVELNFVQE